MNGDAEAGPADSSGTSPVSTIPGWTRTGPLNMVNVLTYASGVGINTGRGDLAPFDGGNNYFNGFNGGASGTGTQMTQAIDLSPGAATIDGGNVTCALSGYIGGDTTFVDNAAVSVQFQDSGGKILSTVALPPVDITDRNGRTGMLYRRIVQQVPAGARTALVTVGFGASSLAKNYAYADNLSLILNAPAAPQSVLGRNLVVNGDAEAGPSSNAATVTQDVPGWSRHGGGNFSVNAYADATGNQPAAVGLATPGKNFFWGGPSVPLHDVTQAYQSYDVSAAASLIDAGQVTYVLSGWLGGYQSEGDYANVTVNFADWNNRILGLNPQIGPVLSSDRNGATELLNRSMTGKVPAGTRYILLTLNFSRLSGTDHKTNNNDGMADSISLVLSGPGGGGGTPAISQGVISAGQFGAFTSIAPGSWIEIYGSNLATGSRPWATSDFNGVNAPTSLDGTSVTIGGQAAFIDYISPGQVNAQVPSSVAPGSQPVVVTTPSGASPPVTITVNQTQPGLLAPASFKLGANQYVVALFPDGVTYVLPPGAISGVRSRRAAPGDTITLYGVGFGSVTPNIPAGQIVQQTNTLAASIQFSFGSTSAALTYSGLAPSFVGLYQFNVTVPNAPASDTVPLTFTLGGAKGAQNLVIAVGN